ncbi:hypothetical protein D3C72_2440880 [compost metagenome]
MDVAHLRHGHANSLYLLGPHVPQHLRSIGFTQGQEQDRGFVDPGQFGGKGSVITHRR